MSVPTDKLKRMYAEDKLSPFGIKPPPVPMCEVHKKEWAKARGLKEYKGCNRSGLRFLDKTLGNEYSRFPGQDHVTYWNKNGKPHVIIAQPYNLSTDEIFEMARLTDKLGLKVYISTFHAWHYPGGVLKVEWSIREELEDLA